jgi:hypothetical protein
MLCLCVTTSYQADTYLKNCTLIAQQPVRQRDNIIDQRYFKIF